MAFVFARRIAAYRPNGQAELMNVDVDLVKTRESDQTPVVRVGAYLLQVAHVALKGVGLARRLAIRSLVLVVFVDERRNERLELVLVLAHVLADLLAIVQMLALVAMELIGQGSKAAVAVARDVAQLESNLGQLDGERLEVAIVRQIGVFAKLLVRPILFLGTHANRS